MSLEEVKPRSNIDEALDSGSEATSELPTTFATSRVVVRPATTSDLDFIVEELKAFDEFHNTKFRLFSSEEVCREVMTKIIETHYCSVAEMRGQLVGFISGYLVAHPLNPKIQTLTEQFWWVKNEYRGSRAGLMLLNDFTGYGRQFANWVLFTLEAQSPVNEKSLTKRGFRLHEKSYIMEVG